MNRDIQKAFLLRLLIIAAIAFGARQVLVLPQVQRAQELADTYQIQSTQLAQGEQAIATHADEVSRSVQRMRRVRDTLSKQLVLSESTEIHKQLQNAAESHRLTVARVEPMRTTQEKRVSGQPPQDIRLEILDFRIECVGPFSGIVGYLQELAGEDHMAKVTSFRLVPISSDSAQVIMQLSVHQLLETPDTFSTAFADSEGSTRISDAGASDE